MKLLSTAILVGLAASPALARQDPTPPPSGEVIHLFGPNSVASQILPGTPPSTPGSASTSGETTSAQPAVEPTFGDIFHQMFVTGDPNKNAPQFPQGRSGAF
ncbi:MAG: hypothetical protein KGH75_07445 [Rhodospirillales bacterium]|nr:hypothetical protein [Rhodospirillales bacterium]